MQRTLSLALALLVVAGCDETTPPEMDAGTDAGMADVDGGSDAGDLESCEATFTWWQKDAYLDEAGRGSAFWPPHTTTSLTVICSGSEAPPQTVVEAEMVNHGTSTADVDMGGTQVLDAVRIETATGTREELSALATAYESCECATDFLSLDALSDTAVEDMVGELATYLNENMTCPSASGGVAQLISDLMAGDIASVLALGPTCSFTAGSWEEGLNKALATVVEVTTQVLADYHVCNNDALLQASIWDEFVSTGVVGTCDTAATFCASPAWYLPCTETDRTACVP